MTHLLKYFKESFHAFSGNYFFSAEYLLDCVKKMIFEMPLEDIAEIRGKKMVETEGDIGVSWAVPEECRRISCNADLYDACVLAYASGSTICDAKKAASPKFSIGQKVRTKTGVEFTITAKWISPVGGYWVYSDDKHYCAGYSEDSLEPAPKFKLKDRVRIPCAGYRNSEPWIVDVVSWYGNNIVYGLYRDGHRMDQPEDRLEADFPKHNFKKGDRVRATARGYTNLTGTITGPGALEYVEIKWDADNFCLMARHDGLELIKEPKFKKGELVKVQPGEYRLTKFGDGLSKSGDFVGTVFDIMIPGNKDNKDGGYLYRIRTAGGAISQWVEENILS